MVWQAKIFFEALYLYKNKKYLGDVNFFFQSDFIGYWIGQGKVGEYRVGASGSWPEKIAKHT